jgi:transcription elongation GreA/GreB family factor
MIAAKTLTINTTNGGCARSTVGFAFLTKRIDAAEVVDPEASRAGNTATQVFFGATVRYATASGTERAVSVVGQDEVEPRGALQTH